MLGQWQSVKSKRIHSVDDLLGGVSREWKSVDPLYWDFSSCPADELDECHAYEYARHVGPILQDVARLRKAKGRSFGQLFGSLRKVVFDPRSLRRGALFWFYPEFPKAPYLGVPAEERQRRMKIAWGSKSQAEGLADMLRPIL